MNDFMLQEIQVSHLDVTGASELHNNALPELHNNALPVLFIRIDIFSTSQSCKEKEKRNKSH